MGITVSFLYFLVPFLHTSQLWVERLGMPCGAEHARTLSRQYVFSLYFSETDITLGDKTRLERWAVPNPFTVASHCDSSQHHGGPSANSSSFEEYLHVLVPTKTFSKKSQTSVTEETNQIHSDTSLPSFISRDVFVPAKPVLFQKKKPPIPLSLQTKVLLLKNSKVSTFIMCWEVLTVIKVTCSRWCKNQLILLFRG